MVSFVHPAWRPGAKEILPAYTKKGLGLLALWRTFCLTPYPRLPAELHRTRSHKIHLGLCDVCFEGTWITDLDRNGKACRMTPGCPGRHRRDGVDHPNKETA